MSNIAEALIAKWTTNVTGLREDYKNRLEVGVWIVEWTKVDGTPAVMECTLDPRYIPLVEAEKPAREVNEDVLPVYSLDRQGWRSFRVKDVKSVYPKPEVF